MSIIHFPDMYKNRRQVYTSIMKNETIAEEIPRSNHFEPKIAEENERYHKEGGERERNAEQNGIY